MSVGMSSPGFFTKKNNEKMNNLKDIMQTLALSVRKLQENAKIEAQFLPAIVITFSPENYRRDIDSHNQGVSGSGFPAGVCKC